MMRTILATISAHGPCLLSLLPAVPLDQDLLDLAAFLALPVHLHHIGPICSPCDLRRGPCAVMLSSLRRTPCAVRRYIIFLVPCTLNLYFISTPIDIFCKGLARTGLSAGKGTCMEQMDLERTRKWAMEAVGTRITFMKNDDPRCLDFEAFLADLTRVAPQIRLETETVDSIDNPGIRLTENLLYHLIPTGLELTPFLDALSMTGGRPVGLDHVIGRQVEAVTLPADLSVFMGLHCPHCPGVIARLTPLAFSNRNIRVSIIDCALFPEEAKVGNVQAVPTVVLDDGFRWTGQLRVEEILDVLIHRDPTALAPSTLERMLKEGGAGRLASMMLEREEIFPAFLGLLESKSWPVRMGAMVVMEELAEKNPALALRTAEPLWQRFDDADDTVKGDLLYVLGELGNREMLPRLRRIQSGPFAGDVKEAAAEAIEKIEDRNLQ
jgi:thiol-disulfide isomerase/thioredoxin